MNHNYQNNNTFSFEITKRIPGQLGRAGIIHTPHGDIKTPAFMCVGTYGEVRFMSMEDLHGRGFFDICEEPRSVP